MSDTVPIVMTAAGLTPQSPASLLAQLIANVAAVNPSYTANLPGGLIEDIASTDVAAIALCDSALVELVNSLTPYGANEFILNQLAQIYGVLAGEVTNTSVNVVFSAPGAPGFVIPKGFTVQDGTHQYIVQDGGIIGADGNSLPLFCLATVPGTWSVPADTVTDLVTSVPFGITLTVTNPLPGTPSAGEETVESFRSRVLQGGLASSQGMARYLKMLLANVPGAQPRLVSPVQINGGGWEILVGGGDPYQVANAIWTALFDVSSLVGSTMIPLDITNAADGEVTTFLNHGYTNGEVVEINGALGMTEINGLPLTVTVVDEKTFTTGVDTSLFGVYTGFGVLTPNPRNQVVSINDFPDTYIIPFVLPPLQTVAITLDWNTNATNPVSAAAMAELGAPALVAYINSIAVGQPINLFELQNAFQIATAAVIPTANLTRMVFAVSINGVGVPPDSGTGIIAGDPESYMETDLTLITISQA